MKTKMKNLKILFATTLTLLIGSAHANAAYYMHILNPDKTQNTIAWNGPGPNNVVDHPEIFPNAQVACWIIDGPNSSMPNAGVINKSGKALIWVEPEKKHKGIVVPVPVFPYVGMVDDLGGTAFMGIGDPSDHHYGMQRIKWFDQLAYNPNTFWISPVNKVYHTYDCD